MATTTNDYRVSLIELATDIARAGMPTRTQGFAGNQHEFLKRFRTAYQHLATSIDAAPSQRFGQSEAEVAAVFTKKP